jgi:hypothetical protein
MAEEKKIIIDEDWKSQVQAEKEEASKQKPGETGSTIATEEDASGLGDMPMPPASFEMLITTLATEALVALGQVPHPLTGKAERQPNQAKFFIDTLDILKQKTKGNLTANEQQALEALLHQLRMAFVETAGTPGAAPQTPK